jgi:GT2 family glycosyltransferase
MKLAILVTCFNRVATTLKGLAALHSALDPIPELSYTIFLVDDGSTDGTGAAVRAAYPDINVIEGTGSLFWNGGMCRAYDAARQHGSFEAYLLFNDDVVAKPDGVAAMFSDFAEANATGPAIVVGSTLSPDGSQITYSGSRRIPSILQPRACQQVFPDGSLRAVDMPNGNFVLVPGHFFDEIGGLDPGYIHNHGDIDLGLVAKNRGVAVVLARSPIGICETNPMISDIFKHASIAKRWKMLQHPLKRPHDYSHFLLKHMPRPLYPFYMAAFHVKRIKSLFFS